MCRTHFICECCAKCRPPPPPEATQFLAWATLPDTPKPCATCDAFQEERKAPPPIPKKPPKGRLPVTREKSLDLPDRQRQEARRRLLAAKRAASFRQNSAGEHADSIEIYIPEAQTRL